jgi:hypothetical protein
MKTAFSPGLNGNGFLPGLMGTAFYLGTAFSAGLDGDGFFIWVEWERLFRLG